MAFRIHALDYASFAPLFDLDDEALRRRGACRQIADTSPGFPCRVSLDDADVGETLLLLNYTHLDVDSPYAARHAIFVRHNARQARPDVGDVPTALASRLLSVRAFDEAGFMQDADVIDGALLGDRLDTLLSDAGIAFVDIHYAKPGCFAARARRP